MTTQPTCTAGTSESKADTLMTMGDTWQNDADTSVTVRDTSQSMGPNVDSKAVSSAPVRTDKSYKFYIHEGDAVSTLRSSAPRRMIIPQCPDTKSGAGSLVRSKRQLDFRSPSSFGEFI